MAKDANGVKIPKAHKADAAPKNDLGHGLSAPGMGGQFNAESSIGRLLLITPYEVEKEIATINGNADATRADVVILDDKGGPTEIANTLVFQKVLQSQLVEAIRNRSKVVGRLFLDEASKKKGQNAPYKLAPPTEAEIKVASDYLDSLDPLR